jgi:uroporphyrinogen-III decarboxylase
MIKIIIGFLLGVWLTAWVMSEYKSLRHIKTTQEMLLKNLELATENLQLADKCKLN